MTTENPVNASELATLIAAVKELHESMLPEEPAPNEPPKSYATDLYGQRVEFTMPADFQPVLVGRVKGLHEMTEAMMTEEQVSTVSKALTVGYQIAFEPTSRAWTIVAPRVRAADPDELVAVLSKQ